MEWNNTRVYQCGINMVNERTVGNRNVVDNYLR